MRPTSPTSTLVREFTNAADGANIAIAPNDWTLVIGSLPSKSNSAPAAATTITLPPNPQPGEFYVIQDPFKWVGASHTINVNGGGINLASGLTSVPVTQTGALSAPNGWGCVEFKYDETSNVWMVCDLPTT